MKHGDKAKAKSAKSSRKTSDKKAGKTGGKSSKAAPPKVAATKRGAEAKGRPGKASPQKGSAGAKTTSGSRPAAAVASREAVARDRAHPVAGEGSRPAAAADPGFGNPLVASAFKRAIKKFPNAFRRLTD